MPGPRAQFADRAQRDLRLIYRWVERTSGRERALALIASIDQRSTIYASSPSAGRLRPELAPEVRSFVSGSYLVLYRPDPDGITVARVIHTSREVDKAWDEPEPALDD